MTQTSKEKGKSSKDLCFMYEATELRIVNVSSYRARLARRRFYLFRSFSVNNWVENVN